MATGVVGLVAAFVHSRLLMLLTSLCAQLGESALTPWLLSAPPSSAMKSWRSMAAEAPESRDMTVALGVMIDPLNVLDFFNNFVALYVVVRVLYRQPLVRSL